MGLRKSLVGGLSTLSAVHRSHGSLRNAVNIHAKILLVQGRVKRRQFTGEHDLGIVMLDCNRGADLVSNDMRPQFDSAE